MRASSATTIAVKVQATTIGERPPLRRNRCAVTAAKMIGAPTACPVSAVVSDTEASSPPISAAQAAQPTKPCAIKAVSDARGIPTSDAPGLLDGSSAVVANAVRPGEPRERMRG